MLAIAEFSSRASVAAVWQRLSTDAQYEIVNAYRDGRLVIVAIVVVIVFMLVRQFKSR